MSSWDHYPANYRAPEVQRILSAISAGESVSVLGLSGAGKSNLIGFLAHRATWPGRFVLVDCNRLLQPSAAAFFRLVYQFIHEEAAPEMALESLLELISNTIAAQANGICFLLDRFDALSDVQTAISNNLRALRDIHKYKLTYVIATRRPLDLETELAELLFANTFWLGPLSETDTAWNVARYAARKGLSWDAHTGQQLERLSWGYPSLLRAVSEAYAMGCPLEIEAMQNHPAVQKRAAEFWADKPSPEMVAASGLSGQPLLGALAPPQMPLLETPEFDTTQFTAKEHLLFNYLQNHSGMVCEKDVLIQAVWPEDQIFESGIRDDSLAQLVRRLRKKIEPDPAAPAYIQTVPGRGYLFSPRRTEED